MQEDVVLPYLQRIWRATLTPASLLTLEEAAEVLPGDDPKALAWLKNHVTPQVELAGKQLYSWADILLATKQQQGTPAQLLSTSDERSGASRSPKKSTGSAIPTPGWLTHQQVQTYLQCDGRTLRSRMEKTPPDQRPWLNIGSQRRAVYRWKAKDIDDWWTEANQWRQLKSEERNTASDGEIRTDVPAVGRARRSPAPESSKNRSKSPALKAPGGSQNRKNPQTLKRYVQDLISKKS